MRVITDEALAVVTIWQEARGEEYVGKVAVAEVIRNRTVHKYNSSGTVADTCLRAFQFSGWLPADPSRVKSVQIDDENSVVQECIRAWAEVWDKDHGDVFVSNIVNGAVLYLNPKAVKKVPAWVANSREVARVGAHIFYVPLR